MVVIFASVALRIVVNVDRGIDFGARKNLSHVIQRRNVVN